MDRYRQLSSLYHRHYHGPEILPHILQQIEGFQDPKNRCNLQHELEYAQSLPESFWTCANGTMESGRDVSGRIVPFPFITTSQILSTTVSLRNLQTTKCSVQPFNVPYDQIWHGEGISIVDITDLSRVSYCLACTREDDAKSKELRFLTPLSAGPRIEAKVRPLAGDRLLCSERNVATWRMEGTNLNWREPLATLR